MAAPIWQPDPTAARESAMARFAADHGCDDYAALHRASVAARDVFWGDLWDFCGVIGEPGGVVLEHGDDMLRSRWFGEARLNFAENLLAGPDAAPALIERDESGKRREISRAELRGRARRLAGWLAGNGFARGDRLAAVAPNRIETVVAMLATTWLGGVFSSCSPDFGAAAVTDRFGQIAPRFLVGCDGYHYNGRHFDCREKMAALRAAMPNAQYLDLASLSSLEAGDPGAPVPMPFDAPVYIMFSSGTTGAPKCIVHGGGGTLLKHLAEHRLHCDVRDRDRLLYFTTCGWMMWNWLVGALASGATVCLYDGAPLHPDSGVLLRYAEEERLDHLGVSPGYLSALAQAGYRPRREHDLTALRSVLSTGSPLPAASFEWFYGELADVRLSSITGGTDIMGCFALGSPTLPVYAGEIQCPGLAMAIAFADDSGQPLARERKGELVCTRSFPSQPVGFWNDPDGTRYRAAYFETYPGIWHHGDFGELTEHGGVVIHGRSDAVLNRGGVRIGTAEIYRQLEPMPEIVEAIAVGQQDRGDLRIVLFVRLEDGVTLDEALTGRIRDAIRAGTSPRHVPDRIVAVADVPRTRSGKLVELAVRNVIHGEPVKNVGALANPEALELFRNLPELK